MAAPAAFAPLRQPVFRGLWLAWLAANMTMWMNDVAAAWLMTSLTSTPLWVALVQAASTLPVFLLALPSGALADIVDRRRYFMVTQFWVAANATLTCAVVLAGWMTPPLLLALTFLNGSSSSRGAADQDCQGASRSRIGGSKAGGGRRAGPGE